MNKSCPFKARQPPQKLTICPLASFRVSFLDFISFLLYALSFFFPLTLRRINVLRPSRVRSRLRKPWRRCRTSRDGRFMFRQRRGPQRIWLLAWAKDGCAEMAVLGTRSAVAASAVAAVEGAKAGVGRRRVVGRLAKMEEVCDVVGVVVVGRRAGRMEKDL